EGAKGSLCELSWENGNSEEVIMSRSMFKIQATDDWFKHAAKIERGSDIGAGLRADSALESQADPLEERRIEQRQAAFAKFVHMLRVNAKLTIDALADRLGVDPTQLLSIEQKLGYKAPPGTLSKLANHYHLPMKPFMALAGAFKDLDLRLERKVIRFAAES